MQRRLLGIGLAFLGAAGLVLAGCSGGRQYTESGHLHYKRSTGEYIDDKAISGKVKKELVADKTVRAGDVNVQAYQGVVQLSGFVDSPEQKVLAEKIARGVPGVKDVQNSLLLKPVAKASTDEDLSPAGKDVDLRQPTADKLDTSKKDSIESSSKTEKAFAHQKASKLIGMKVENQQEQKLGDVEDIALDAASGKIAYVVVSSGGVLGIGDKLHAVPAGAFSFDSADNNLVLNVSKERWKESPVFDEKDTDGLADADREKEIYTFYDVQQGIQNKTAGVSSPTREKLEPTGKDSADAVYRKGPRIQMASEMIGKRVINREQDRVGHIADMLVDLDSSRGALAILETDQYLGEKDGRFLIPAGAFTSMQGERHFILDVDKKSFEGAQAFNTSTWHTGASVEVFSYDPTLDNSARRIDASTQSEKATDLELTQKIRKEVMANDSFSSSAKNVQIIASNGKITLKGTVASRSEEKAIVEIADRIAGKSNVDNELVIQK